MQAQIRLTSAFFLDLRYQVLKDLISEDTYGSVYGCIDTDTG